MLVRFEIAPKNVVQSPQGDLKTVYPKLADALLARQKRKSYAIAHRVEAGIGILDRDTIGNLCRQLFEAGLGMVGDLDFEPTAPLGRLLGD